MTQPVAETASTLLDELAAAPPEALRFLVANPRFHRGDLLELILHQAEKALLSEPEQTDRLSRLATRIAGHVLDDPETVRSVMAQAQCLSANRYRLAGLMDLADEALRASSTFLDIRPGSQEPDRAASCRTLALVRWEQGRLDEALALLRHAWSLFEECKAIHEWRTCAFLLALLYDEMGCPAKVRRTVGPLVGDRFDRSLRPWLTSRAFLTFAAFAADELPHALAALEEGIQGLGQVSDAQEQLRLYCLEGRARACLGFFDEAEQILEAVRRQHLVARRTVELTLVSLDLLALRSAAERPPRIDELLADLMDLRHQPTLADVHASCALERFVSFDMGGEAPWASARNAATWYLQTLRFAGLRPAPIPFA